MEGLIFLASIALIYYLCEVFAWGNCHETIRRRKSERVALHSLLRTPQVRPNQQPNLDSAATLQRGQRSYTTESGFRPSL